MSVLGIHVLTDAAYTHLKEAAAAAGHEVIASEKTAISALWEETKVKFPALVADMQKISDDLKASDMPGGQKAVKVALDVIGDVPDVLKALPDLKAFLVHGATELYAAGIDGLEHAALGLLGKL